MRRVQRLWRRAKGGRLAKYMLTHQELRWADEQRRQYKCGDLHQSRIKRLDSCGFNWHIPEKGWMVHFSSLCMHHQRHGSADVGVLQNGTRVQLGAWLSWQRSAWRRGKLPSERSRLLLSLGVRKMVAADSEAEHAVDVAVGWLGEDSHAEQPPKSVDSSGWEGMYGELLLFRMRLGQVDNIAPEVWRGSSPIPQTRRSRRRKSARPGSLDQHQRDTAERVEQLASWVLGHKEAYKLGRLSGRWQTKLESAGVIFDQNRVRWVERYRQLLDYKRESNGTWTGRLGKGKGGLGGKRPRLAQWVKRQVRASQQGLLSGARCRLLERLGISHLGETDGGDWKVMFAELRRYQNTCNDRSAGFGWTVSPKLGGWVHQQRILHRSGDLRPMRERLLRGTGLSLAVGKRSWNGRLVELEAFRARWLPIMLLSNVPACAQRRLIHGPAGTGTPTSPETFSATAHSQTGYTT